MTQNGKTRGRETRFWTVGLPRALHRTRPWIVLAVSVFILGTLCGMLIIALSPGSERWFFSANTIADLQQGKLWMFRPSIVDGARYPHWLVFVNTALFLWLTNLRVALNVFASGCIFRGRGVAVTLSEWSICLGHPLAIVLTIWPGQRLS